MLFSHSPLHAKGNKTVVLIHGTTSFGWLRIWIRFADSSGVTSDVLLGIFWWRRHTGERRQGQCGDAAGDRVGVGAGGDGDGLLRRPHLRRPLQPRRHHRFRLLQEVLLEAGMHARKSRFIFHLPTLCSGPDLEIRV